MILLFLNVINNKPYTLPQSSKGQFLIMTFWFFFYGVMFGLVIEWQGFTIFVADVMKISFLYIPHNYKNIKRNELFIDSYNHISFGFFNYFCLINLFDFFEQHPKHIPQKHCKKVPKKSCHDVPKHIPSKHCKDIPHKHCHDVPVKHPKKVCVDIPKKHCSTHPVKHPKKVIYGTNLKY